MFQTNYTAGGRLDTPHYPTYQAPYVVGMQEFAPAKSVVTLEYEVPFRGELFAISIDCTEYYNDDNWTMKVNGEVICEQIYVKRAPEGVSLMAFIEVAPGDKITIDFTSLEVDKHVWASLHFLKEGNFSKPEGTSKIRVNVPAIRLYIWDYSAIDGDILNVFVNSALIRENMELVGDAPFPGVNGVNYIEIPLQPGDNEIIFEGVSAGTSGPLSARFRVLDTEGKTLYKSDELPSLSISRTNVKEPSGEYNNPRPRVSWIVNRTM